MMMSDIRHIEELINNEILKERKLCDGEYIIGVATLGSEHSLFGYSRSRYFITSIFSEAFSHICW
jgi:hypothetical protein